MSTCPLSATADPRFAALRPRAIDPSQSERIKREFLTGYSQDAKLFCRYLVGTSFSKEVYNKMLDVADRLAIWSYSGLEMWVVPYALLTLVDFEGRSSAKQQDYRFAFVFDKPSKGAIDDLWLRPSDCRLKKVFCSNGNLMKFPEGNPYPVSETFFTSR